MKNELTKEQVKEFVKDLNKLTAKHGVVIGGCGCCSSPYLYLLEKARKDGKYSFHPENFDDLKWKSDTDKY
jgi:hypothetical protein